MMESQLLPSSLLSSTLCKSSDKPHDYRIPEERLNINKSPERKIGRTGDTYSTAEEDEDDDQYDDESHCSSEANHCSSSEQLRNVEKEVGKLNGKWIERVDSHVSFLELDPACSREPAGQDVPATSKSSVGNEMTTDEQIRKPVKAVGITTSTTKACAKKSFVWKYFRHPELISGVIDRSRTQCILCESQLAFNASGTTTTMLNHLKSRHGEVAEQEEFQRRHTRVKGTQNHSVESVNPSQETSDGADKINDPFYRSSSGHKQIKLPRSPNSQRGRSLGGPRRQKLTKPSSGSEGNTSGHLFTNGSMKLDPNALFPFGCYSGLTDQQNRTLINEMLLSTEALANSKNKNVFTQLSDQRHDLGDLFPSAGLIGSNGKRIDMNENSLTLASTKFLSSPLFNRTSLLHAVNAFSSGLTFPVTNSLNTHVPNDLSPASSSGLGISVSSPSGTPATNTSPISSAENGNLTSPIHQSHWTGGQTQTQLKFRTEHTNSGTQFSKSQESGFSKDQGPISGNGVKACISESPSLNADIQSKLNALGLLHRDSTHNLNAGVGASSVVSTSSSNPVDLAGTFGNFMGFVPSLTNAANALPYATFDPFGIVQQETEPGKQQWLANAWLSGLANSKSANNATTFMDPAMVMSFLNNNNNSNNSSSSSSYPKAGNDSTFTGCTNDDKKGTDLLSKPRWTSTDGPMQEQHTQPTSAKLVDWSHLSRPSNVATALTASPLLTSQSNRMNSVCTSAFNNAKSLSNSPSIPPSGEPLLRSNNSVEECAFRNTESDCNETLDLSKAKVVNLEVSPSASSIEIQQQQQQQWQQTKPSDENANNTVTTKRKRSRPIYISPEDTSKRPNMESVLSQVKTDTENSSGRPDSPFEENDHCSMNQESFVNHLVRYLIQDMMPPDVIEGDGFKMLMTYLTRHILPSVKELREEVFPQVVTKVKAVLDTKVATYMEPTALANEQRKPITISLSAELWHTSCSATATPDWSIQKTSPLNDDTYVNVGVHGLNLQTSTMFQQLRNCIAVNDANSLREEFEHCVSSCQSIRQPPQTESRMWPIPLVTNRAFELAQRIAIEGDQVDDGIDRFLIVPCLISELAHSVQAGLNCDSIRASLNKYRRILSSINEYGPSSQSLYFEDKILGTEDSKGNISWSEACVLLQSCSSPALHSRMSADGIELLRQLKTILETMNQTLQLLHQKDLQLTASMIDPILHTLIETHLAFEGDQDDATNRSVADSAVAEFKQLVSSHLNKAYPLAGNLRDTLQLASLLDPRFKDHMNERKPSAIALLKQKVEDLPTNSELSESPNDHYSSLSTKTKPTTDTDGLQTVFGLQRYSRHSLSEVDRYLREDPIGLEQNPFGWWAEKSNSYPRVAALASYYLNIPLTCFAQGRLRPLSNTRSNEHALKSDGLGLPNIIDPLAVGRSRISSQDQSTYNLLWHHLELPHSC